MNRPAAALSALLTAASAHAEPPAPDPVAAYPDNYRVLLENDRVRVLDFRLGKGASEKSHAHPAHLAVFLEEFTIRFTAPDGKQSLREARPHHVSWSEPTVHASENIGLGDAHGILVELKPPRCPAE